jgi:hypothetical protein
MYGIYMFFIPIEPEGEGLNFPVLMCLPEGEMQSDVAVDRINDLNVVVLYFKDLIEPQQESFIN